MVKFTYIETFFVANKAPYTCQTFLVLPVFYITFHLHILDISISLWAKLFFYQPEN